MALIEGVGDEVTLLFAALMLVSVLLLAWISTRTSEPSEHLLTDHAPTHRTDSAHQDTPSTSANSDVTESSSSVLSSDAPAVAVPEEKAADGGGREEDSGRGRCAVGGASPPPQRNMVVRLKFLNDTETMAQVQPQDTIGYIKRTYFPGQEQQIRLIYQGQLLQDDDQTLQSLNLGHNCVLHCHISQHTPRSSSATPAGPRPGPDQVQVALNVGSLMVPLLVLMLSVLWYCQIQYRQFFTAPATASLVGVTILISLVAFGVYRR